MATPPITPQDKDAYLASLNALLEALRPLQPNLTKDEQRKLSARAMGPAGIPFAQQAGLVLTNFKPVLSRRLTDATIAAYPGWLTTFADATDLLVPARALVEALTRIALHTGVQVMDVAREVYDNVKDDKGRTPGLADIQTKMAERFKQTKGPEEPPLNGITPKA
jgi:hypothetical protein